MALIEIPVTNLNPSFSFSTELEGLNYNFQFRYLDRLGIWTFDLLDGEKTPIELGMPFQVNLDLLVQNRQDNRPPGTLLCINYTDNAVDAGRFEMGTDVRLLYLEDVDDGTI